MTKAVTSSSIGFNHWCFVGEELNHVSAVVKLREKGEKGVKEGLKRPRLSVLVTFRPNLKLGCTPSRGESSLLLLFLLCCYYSKNSHYSSEIHKCVIFLL